jgi:hypothetical protein
MIDEIPNINDLLDTYEEDPDWNELISIYNELTDIVYKCFVELHPFLFQDNKFLPDDRHYILLYLFRSKRIFNSILLLLIYECYAEAQMLKRALLENVVDTKLFMKVGTRARNKRKVKLYHLLNEKRRLGLYKEDYRESKEKYGKFITSVAIAKMNFELEEKINEGLKNFSKSEISEMELKVNRGESWHGHKPKGAFKKCGMKVEYEDYNMSCTFLHVRDWPFPSGLLKSKDTREIDIAIQLEFNKILTWLVDHLQDYMQYCPNTLSDEVVENMIKYKEKLCKLINNYYQEEGPEKYSEFSELVEVIKISDDE